MTAPEREVKRLTKHMFDMLMWAERGTFEPGEVEVLRGHHIRTARILERRGLVTMKRGSRYPDERSIYRVRLTQKGRAAIAMVVAK